MRWPRKAYPRAGRKVGGSKEPVNTSLRVAVSKEKSHKWKWLKIMSQDHIRQYPRVLVDDITALLKGEKQRHSGNGEEGDDEAERSN